MTSPWTNSRYAETHCRRCSATLFPDDGYDDGMCTTCADAADIEDGSCSDPLCPCDKPAWLRMPSRRSA